MKSNMKSLTHALVTYLVLLLTATTATADSFYKCIAPDGSIEFKRSTCSKYTQAQTVGVSETNVIDSAPVVSQQIKVTNEAKAKKDHEAYEISKKKMEHEESLRLRIMEKAARSWW
jgi:hypothetical protein